MIISPINICFLILIFSYQLFGQFDIHVENSNNIRKEYLRFEPTKVTEIRIQKDKFGKEYEAWSTETIFTNNRVSRYSQNSDNRIYLEIYNWEQVKNEIRLIRYDSTFYMDTTNLYRFGSNLSNRVNHQDTFTLLFNQNGNLIQRKGSGKFGGNIYNYDYYNNLIYLKTVDNEDSTMSSKKWIHEYDSEGRIIESNIYSQNVLTDSFRIIYDDTVTRINRITFLADKPILSKIIYSYFDIDGNLVKKVEESCSEEMDEKVRMEYFYDYWGNVIFESGSTFIMDELFVDRMKYEYQYDDKGNWLECTTYLKRNDEQEFKWFNKDVRIIKYD